MIFEAQYKMLQFLVVQPAMLVSFETGPELSYTDSLKVGFGWYAESRPPYSVGCYEQMTHNIESVALHSDIKIENRLSFKLWFVEQTMVTCLLDLSTGDVLPLLLCNQAAVKVKATWDTVIS